MNQALGVVEVRNEAAIEQLQPKLEQVAEATGNRLFAHVSDKDLERLGVDANTRTIARRSGRSPSRRGTRARRR